MKILIICSILAFALSHPIIAMTVSREWVERELASAPYIADIAISDASPAGPDTEWLRPKQYRATVQTWRRSARADMPSTIVFNSLGGERNGRGILYPGYPRPIIGETYRAHLKQNANGQFEIAGLEFGLTPLNPIRNYSRNRTDGSNGGGDGAFLYWNKDYLPLPFYLASDSLRGLPQYRAAIDQSFKTWRDVSESKLEFVPMGCTASNRNINDGINSVIFITENWPFDPAAIAVTRNFYLSDASPQAGMILDTDILLNGVDHHFTTTGDLGAFDLQNIVTHEVGHFLGLGHEVDPMDADSTMFAIADPNETKKRDLAQSDEEGVRNTYPGTGNKGVFTQSLCSIEGTSNTGCLSAGRASSTPLPFWIAASYLICLSSFFARAAHFVRGKRSISSR